MNKKMIAMASLLSVTSLVVVGGALATDGGVSKVKASDDCIHNGYRYAANEATDTKEGNVEFWTCCECHNYFLTKPSVGTFIDASSEYGYELPNDVVIPRTGKITVNSVTLTFNGVDYTENDWSSKDFVLGDAAPSWSIASDPSFAAQYVDIWITKNQVEVNGWPTEVGDYVFCVGIKENNTRIGFGTNFTCNFYVAFSIIPQEKVTPTITITVDGQPTSHAIHYNAAPAFGFVTDPADAASSATYFYTKDDGKTNLGTTAPTTPGTYAFNVRIDANDNYNAATAFVWYVIDATEKIEVDYIVGFFNGVGYEASNWQNKPFTKGAPAPEWSAVTVPSEAAQYVDFWIVIFDTETRVNGWPTQVGDYTFCIGILDDNEHIKKGSGYNGNIYLKFSIVE